jgi:hypothetical protein
LLLFLTLGIVLEALHAFKIGSYLSVAHETRRLMWTLAQAHGTLLGLVNLASPPRFASSPIGQDAHAGLSSAMLIGATLLMPAGFFLGGVNPRAGDPGLGIHPPADWSSAAFDRRPVGRHRTKHYRE